MKKSWLLFILLLLLSLAAGGVAAAGVSVSTLEPGPTPMPSPPPPVVGPGPAGPLVPDAPPPQSWIQVGPVSFDAGLLTAEERIEMIHKLQLYNMRASTEERTIVAGLETTRDAPCYRGQSARFPQTLYGDQADEATVTMTLAGVLRGEEAERIAERMAAQVYSEGNGLTEGMEYAVCTFHISIAAEDPNLQMLFTTYDFQAISADGRAINQPILLAGDESYLTVVPGGSGALRVVLAVEKSSAPTILYLKSVWFSMLEPA